MMKCVKGNHLLGPSLGWCWVCCYLYWFLPKRFWTINPQDAANITINCRYIRRVRPSYLLTTKENTLIRFIHDKKCSTSYWIISFLYCFCSWNPRFLWVGSMQNPGDGWPGDTWGDFRQRRSYNWNDPLTVDEAWFLVGQWDRPRRRPGPEDVPQFLFIGPNHRGKSTWRLKPFFIKKKNVSCDLQ